MKKRNVNSQIQQPVTDFGGGLKFELNMNLTESVVRARLIASLKVSYLTGRGTPQFFEIWITRLNIVLDPTIRIHISINRSIFKGLISKKIM